MNWEDFKKTVKEKPWILGLLIISGIVVIYLVLRTRKKEEPAYMPAGQVITPEPVAGGGPIGGSVPSSDTGLIADILTGFAQAQGQALASIAEQQREAIQGLMEGITKSQSELLSKITQSQQEIIKQLQAGLQEVKTVKETTIQDFGLFERIKTPEKTFYVTPVTTLSGGIGGGYAVTETPAQMAELLRGGSRNVGGSYTLDYRGWEPAPPGQPGSSSYAREQVSKVTGKTGTIESQLSGMTQAQKLETLKKAGLIR